MHKKVSPVFWQSESHNGRADEQRMTGLAYTDKYIASIFQSIKTIAMVGASPKPHRASHRVMRFLQEQGYRVIPVNTRNSDGIINGEMVYNSLDDIVDDFQMVDIFRNIEGAVEITSQAINLIKKKNIKVIWMQLEIQSSIAAQWAENAGIKIVMDRCPAIEIARLIRSGKMISGVNLN